MILFPIKTLAAIFNKTAKRPSASESSNQISPAGRHIWSVGVSLACCCCNVNELGLVVGRRAMMSPRSRGRAWSPVKTSPGGRLVLHRLLATSRGRRPRFRQFFSFFPFFLKTLPVFIYLYVYLNINK